MQVNLGIEFRREFEEACQQIEVPLFVLATKITN